MELIRKILEQSITVAVVGFSTDPRKAAHRVPARMVRHGYEVTPIHPSAPEILGRRAYTSLAEFGRPVDLVVVFRPSAEAEEVALEALRLPTKALWLQLGITSGGARNLAANARVDYVEDACVAIELDRLGLAPRAAS